MKKTKRKPKTRAKSEYPKPGASRADALRTLTKGWSPDDYVRNSKAILRTSFALRGDGRYQAYYHDLDSEGKPIYTSESRHIICGRDPERLFWAIVEKESPHVCTFAEVCNDWQRQKWETLANQSIASYKSVVRDVLDEFGDCPLDAITPKDVSAFLNVLAAKGYAQKTVEARLHILNMTFDYAIQNGLASLSPTDHVTMPRNLPKGDAGIAPDEAIKAIEERWTEFPFGLYPFLLRYSGLRRSEALALRHEDIDRKKGVIHITKSLEFLGNSPHVKTPKTDAGTRDVMLLGVLADAIPLGIGYVFPSPKDPMKPMSYSQFSSAWNRFRKAIGFDITPRQLRRAYATLLYEMGMGAKAIQSNMGHTNVALSLGVYAYYRDDERNNDTKKANDFIRRSHADACSDDCISAKNG